MQQWIEVYVPVTAACEEAVTNYLFEIGCVGCQQFRDGVRAYFTEDGPRHDLLMKVDAYLHALSALGISDIPSGARIRTIADRDWNAEWKKHFKPLTVSGKFIVKPTWEPVPAAGDAMVIEIDPKQAFGTGHHATTRLMLRFLEERVPAGCRVLDVGTGTGILAIAAIKLGAGRVVALDVDPVATAAAAENLQLNSAALQVGLITGGVDCLANDARGFDIILANIDRKGILRIIEELSSRLQRAGRLLLSGILQSEAAAVKNRVVARTGLTLARESVEDEWAGLVFVRRAS